jgi:NAD-dependent DNA ligase
MPKAVKKAAPKKVAKKVAVKKVVKKAVKATAPAELPEPKARASTKLSVMGKTVVITGTVTGMERADAEAKLEGLGARCTSSVSKKTDYVFAMADAGSKKADAERLGIPVLTETVLFSLIGSPGKPKGPKKPVSSEAKEKVAERKPDLADGFDGKTVVITGTLSRGRSEIAAMLEGVGAKVAGSVSANTHYLITGAGVGASKLTKATSLGVTIIDEPTMNDMLGG